MRTRRSFLCSVTALALLSLASSTGCSWSVGGSKGNTSSNTPIQSPTRGQELIDLQKAHEAGAISDEEYGAMKHRIMNQ